MENTNVRELIAEIKGSLSQKSASQKDEVRVMREMLNDMSYEVGVYGKDGLEGTYCPAKEARQMISSVIASTTKISNAEAEQLANNYEFKKSEASAMVGISKQFVNTYLETGRKLPFGGREYSDISIIGKDVEATTRPYPKKVGIDEEGKAIYETAQIEVKPHRSAKIISSCPSWIK